MKHEMKLREIYFDKIKSGEKIYEIRLNDEKRQLIKVGDMIVFKKETEFKEELTTKVKDLIYFDNFSELIDTLPVEKVGFENMSKQEIINVYRQIYSKEDESKYGVVAIKVQVMEK